MLLIGFGNQGRGDDGLGPIFADRIERRNLAGLDIDADYQLTVDHALLVSGADRVVFADALMGSNQPFSFEKVDTGEASDMGSHSLTPAAVLSLAATLYGHSPEAFVLGIAGYVFGDVREGLSREALGNLDLAEAFFLEWHSGQSR
jgi:hydrogenase maturation protease